MNLTPLSPLVVGLVLSLIPALSKNERHRLDGLRSVYAYPKVGAYILLLLAILFAASPWFLPLISRRSHEATKMSYGQSPSTGASGK